MQLDEVNMEREVSRLLPEVIDELFDHEGEPLRLSEPERRGVDFHAEGHGTLWWFEVKKSSSPGLVRAAAETLGTHTGEGLRVLVVPFMTPAGKKAANRLGLNWVDLSGNAHIRSDHLYISVQGKANRFVRRGRPSSPFAPKSARITRTMLLDPGRWWRRKELSGATDLDSGQVSRVVKRLFDLGLLEEEGQSIRPRDPGALLDAWEDEYRFDRHEVIRGHASGVGIELSRRLQAQLDEAEADHAFTGLAAAWAFQGFARFRLNSVYVEGDPHRVAEGIGLRLNERGANVQLIAPNDAGVFTGARSVQGLRCVAPVQAYLDLRHLPERASEAADEIRKRGLWNGA